MGARFPHGAPRICARHVGDCSERAWRFYKHSNDQSARNLFFTSLMYLPALLAMLMLHKLAAATDEDDDDANADDDDHAEPSSRGDAAGRTTALAA